MNESSVTVYVAECGCEARFTPRTDTAALRGYAESLARRWAKDHSLAHDDHLVSVYREWRPDGGIDRVDRYQNGEVV